MSNKKSSSVKSVSFDDYPDSPTFPRWRALSSSSVNSIGYYDDDTLPSEAVKGGTKGVAPIAKRRTRVSRIPMFLAGNGNDLGCGKRDWYSYV